MEYQSHGEPLEHAGEMLAMLDSAGHQVATLRVTRAKLLRFADVPDEFALAEGEGDFTGDEFRTSHGASWRAMGYPIHDDTIVATVYFDLVEVLN